jgi:hypothetical protein
MKLVYDREVFSPSACFTTKITEHFRFNPMLEEEDDFTLKDYKMPVPMAARSEARTVFGNSNTGFAGSNPARGMDVGLRFVLCR